MWDFMVSVSSGIESVVSIKWVWAVISLSVWFLCIWISIKTEPEYRRTEAAMLASLTGAFIGFIFPMILVLLPFLLPILLMIGAVALIGVVIANYTEIGK